MFYGLDTYFTEQLSTYTQQARLVIEQSQNCYTLTTRQLVIKRTFDLIVASIALFLTLPTMLMIAIAVKLDSPGPALFKQQRVGMNGNLFTIYKFRSMVEDAEERLVQMDEQGNLIHKRPDDPRLTRLGRLLRQTSLDELPQIFNVLRGDMSIVGPRPELPWLVDDYQTWQRQRLNVPQGITGWWQINDRADAPLHLNTQTDLHYIRHYSIWFDLYIILMTIPALIRHKGAF